MWCSSCSAELPVRGSHCPTCGVATPHNISLSKSSPYEPTVLASSFSDTSQKPPPPLYNSPDPSILQQNPYEALNPYAVPPLVPPPPQTRGRVWKRLFIVLGSLIGFVLTSIGVVGFFVSLENVMGLLKADSGTMITSFIMTGIFLCVGTFVFCKCAVSAIGRYTAVFSALLAAILIIFSLSLPNHTSAEINLIGAVLLLLLAGIFWRCTRIKKW